MSPSVPGASTRYVLSVTAGLECPSHTDTALTSILDCSHWRAQLCRRLWLPGPFLPVPVAISWSQAMVMPWAIQRFKVRPEDAAPPRTPDRRAVLCGRTMRRPPTPGGPAPPSNDRTCPGAPRRCALGRKTGDRARSDQAPGRPPEQERQQPGLARRHGVKELAHLVRRPVVGDLALRAWLPAREPGWTRLLYHVYQKLLGDKERSIDRFLKRSERTGYLT